MNNSNSWSGGCQCGAIRFALKSAPVLVYTCHCTDCQKQSSSAFGISVWAEREDFEIQKGSAHNWIKNQLTAEPQFETEA